MNRDIHLLNDSFIELNARERAQVILDKGTFHELLNPFLQIESPHLIDQGIVPQSDDGVVVAKGSIEGQSAVVVSLDGRFQGGAIGEVSGAKIAGALELALKDNLKGIPTRAVLLLESGGIRLQEGNYGLLAIAEIHASIIALKRYQPVVCVIAGLIGCFGGMSIAAGLCSSIIMTRQGRLQLNGSEVIEQEAGIQELDSKDRRLIWSMAGGEQRVETGIADLLVKDNTLEIQQVVSRVFQEETITPRSSQVNEFLDRLAQINMEEKLTPESVRSLMKEKDTADGLQSYPVQQGEGTSRGHIFFRELTVGAKLLQTGSPSVLCADTVIGDEPIRWVAVVPDSSNRFPRARNGEVGLDEGWSIAQCVRQAVEEDKHSDKRAIIAVVDVPSQAYGFREELLGIHAACAAAVDAYATARLAGHPVIALIVGNAISGAFLSHGLQANRMIALDDPQVAVQVMSKQSIARITRRSIEEVEEKAAHFPATASDVSSFASLGALHQMIKGINAAQPTGMDIKKVKLSLLNAISDARNSPLDLSSRLQTKEAKASRSYSIAVRTKLEELWI